MAPAGMTIDELARRARTTTRNVRALQTSSLLIKPEILGRTAHYGEAHLERLVAVLRLQQEGFSIASIRALLEALSAGRSLADVLGVPSRAPGILPVTDLSRRGPSLDPDAHLFFSASEDPEDEFTSDPARPTGDPGEDFAATGNRRHLRLLSDIPTTILDEAI
jgi:DNA-binding transcriptional MerR regulator